MTNAKSDSPDTEPFVVNMSSKHLAPVGELILGESADYSTTIPYCALDSPSPRVPDSFEFRGYSADSPQVMAQAIVMELRRPRCRI